MNHSAHLILIGLTKGKSMRFRRFFIGESV